jgi:hypothetical protein
MLSIGRSWSQPSLSGVVAIGYVHLIFDIEMQGETRTAVTLASASRLPPPSATEQEEDP